MKSINDVYVEPVVDQFNSPKEYIRIVKSITKFNKKK